MLTLEHLRTRLSSEGWDFTSPNTKILMLTHNVLAAEQDYPGIAGVFPYNDSFVRKDDPYIKFFIDTVEAACQAFQNGRYGEMLSAMGARAAIRGIEDKRSWTRDLRALIELRESRSIGEVLDLLKQTERPQLPDDVLSLERQLERANPEAIEESTELTQISELRTIPYKEVTQLALFVNERTPFSTKHGVKGAEFDEVMVVLGRGWNQYNWDQFLQWFPDRYPNNREESYVRNRNLFYVCCSRARKATSTVVHTRSCLQNH